MSIKRSLALICAVSAAIASIGQSIPSSPENICLNAEDTLTTAALKKDFLHRFTLKTNMLYYAALMPNAEIEWMFGDRWSTALEAQAAWYAKNSPHKAYRLAVATPEVRYWIISRSRWHGMYAGLFGGVGLYDLSNGKKGYEGEGVMAGLSAGYMWPIGKRLSLEAGLGAGYMHTRYKEYVPIDNHFVYQLTKDFNYFGPLRLKLSLVWRFQSKDSSRRNNRENEY